MSALSRKEQRPARAERCSFLCPAAGKLRPRGGALRRRRTPPPEPPPALALWRLGAEGEKVVPRPRVGHRPTTRPGGLPHRTRLAGSRCSPARRSAAKCSRRALRGSGAGACAARQKGKAKPFGRCAALPFSPARLRPGLFPRRCSGPKIGPVRWWPCFGPSAPNGPPGFAPPAGGPFGRSRPVPLALRYHLRRAGGRGHRRRRG